MNNWLTCLEGIYPVGNSPMTNISRMEIMTRSGIPVWVFNSILRALAFVILGIAVYGGPTYILFCVLLGVSVIAVWKPKIIPFAVLYLTPLVAGKSGMVLGVLTPASLLALWFTVIGGAFYIQILIETGLRVHKLAMYLFALVIVAFASLIPSANKMDTIEEVIRILSIALMLSLSIFLSRQKQFRVDTIKVVFISSATPLIVGLYQKLSGNLQLGGARLTQYEIQAGITVRLYSTFYDAHPFAKYLLVILVITFALLLQRNLSRKIQLIASGFFLLVLWELNLTYARGPLIGFAAAALAMLYMSKRLKLRQIVLLVSAFGIVLYATGNINRFLELLGPSEAMGPSSVDIRVSLWESAFQKVLENPIGGNGAASFEHAFGIIAHNDYLGLWYELGITGVVLYVFLLAYGALIAFTYARRLDGIDKSMALAGFGLTLAIAIGSLAENYFGANTLWWYYVGVLGYIIGAYHARFQPGRETP